MTLEQAAQLLRENDEYLILTHQRPDGDTMGSAAALCHVLRLMGKTAYLFNNPQFEDNLPWVVEPYLAPEGYEGKFVVAVDTASETMFPIGFKGKAKLCFDHHPSNTGYAEHTVSMNNKAACGEIILELIHHLAVKLDKTAANLLYVAISTDTGCFVYGNTTADTFRAAAELCDAGAEHRIYNKILFRTSSKQRIVLEGMIYSSMRFYHDGKTVFAFVTREMMEKSGAKEKDCTDIAALPGRVEGACTSAVIKEVGDNHCKISVRTNGIVNANHVCNKFGGGGHAMAAGCTINKGVDEAAALLEAAIAEELK